MSWLRLTFVHFHSVHMISRLCDPFLALYIQFDPHQQSTRRLKLRDPYHVRIRPVEDKTLLRFLMNMDNSWVLDLEFSWWLVLLYYTSFACFAASVFIWQIAHLITFQSPLMVQNSETQITFVFYARGGQIHHNSLTSTDNEVV